MNFAGHGEDGRPARPTRAPEPGQEARGPWAGKGQRKPGLSVTDVYLMVDRRDGGQVDMRRSDQTGDGRNPKRGPREPRKRKWNEPVDEHPGVGWLST